ncbi:MAG: RNA ligase (ATP) [Candidatus Lokiarchaeota archaeon]|nr:RNA ligase (ATP) [Candidatus Lokiarchaeota archaeon]MBD3200054.1 RNA ligase (ATP) [Candidatus Lokiarchaeota archaeon]
MRKLASVQEIRKIEPIPNADKLELAYILGWNVVVKKGEFEVGDHVVYIEVDSLLPERPEFEFLRDYGFRIRTIKLRGQISQGIAFSLSILPEEQEFNIGDDVTDLLGIKKYEPPIPIQLSGEEVEPFPEFIPKTDEVRIQTIPDLLEKYKGENLYITEKIDGTSGTYYIRGKEFGVCSRNQKIQEDETNLFWIIARETGIENILRNYGKNIAIQGEVIGPKVQNNKYKLTTHRVFIFNIFDIETQNYIEFRRFKEISNKLGFKTVPILYEEYKLNDTVDSLVELAKGQSKLNPDLPREGIILRSLEEISDPEYGRVSFKVLNPKFLLKFE